MHGTSGNWSVQPVVHIFENCTAIRFVAEPDNRQKDGLLKRPQNVCHNNYNVCIAGALSTALRVHLIRSRLGLDDFEELDGSIAIQSNLGRHRFVSAYGNTDMGLLEIIQSKSGAWFAILLKKRISCSYELRSR